MTSQKEVLLDPIYNKVLNCEISIPCWINWWQVNNDLKCNFFVWQYLHFFFIHFKTWAKWNWCHLKHEFHIIVMALTLFCCRTNSLVPYVKSCYNHWPTFVGCSRSAGTPRTSGSQRLPRHGRTSWTKRSERWIWPIRTKWTKGRQSKWFH